MVDGGALVGHETVLLKWKGRRYYDASHGTAFNRRSEPESTYAWLRLGAALAVMTIGGSGMYAMAVALAPVQAEFGVTRGDASLPYTLTMLGFGIGGIVMGRLADRFGVVVPVTIGALGLGSGFILAGNASTLLQFSLAHGLLIGFLGCSTTFAPLVADTSLWFTRRRGIAVAICASGNYLAGAVWPPILQYLFDTAGWRATYIGMGIFCAAAMLLFALALRRRPPALETALSASQIERTERPLGLAPNTLMTLLIVAGIGCCVAMSMPQVHIVAYCGDLGYGAARGAEMLSIMLGVRHRQPPALRLDLRPHRRAAHPAPRLVPAGRGAAAVPAVRRPGLALRRFRDVRPVPGRHRARPTPSSCASTSRRAKPACAPASC